MQKSCQRVVVLYVLNECMEMMKHRVGVLHPNVVRCCFSPLTAHYRPFVEQRSPLKGDGLP